MEEKKKIPVFNIIIIILLLISLAVNLFIGLNSLDNKEETAVKAIVKAMSEGESYSAKEMAALMTELGNGSYEEGYNALKTILKDRIIEGNSANAALREIFTEDIVYIYENEYVFKPINKELPLNNLKDENFIVNDKDLRSYTISYKDEKSNIIGYKGIDVSKFQGEIDWEMVASDGVDFAFIRAGYRGYETGKIVEDENCKYNIENALKNNIKTGVYFYTQAITKEEAIEEAEFVINTVKDYDINYPIAFDLEVVGEDTARTNKLNVEQRVEIVKAFCNTIKEAGYKPMLYGNLATMFSMVEFEELNMYDKWFAYYDTELYYPYDLGIWQYSCTGKIAGIEADCDLNLAFKDLSY